MVEYKGDVFIGVEEEIIWKGVNLFCKVYEVMNCRKGDICYGRYHIIAIRQGSTTRPN